MVASYSKMVIWSRDSLANMSSGGKIDELQVLTTDSCKKTFSMEYSILDVLALMCLIAEYLLLGAQHVLAALLPGGGGGQGGRSHQHLRLQWPARARAQRGAR